MLDVKVVLKVSLVVHMRHEVRMPGALCVCSHACDGIRLLFRDAPLFPTLLGTHPCLQKLAAPVRAARSPSAAAGGKTKKRGRGKAGADRSGQGACKDSHEPEAAPDQAQEEVVEMPEAALVEASGSEEEKEQLDMDALAAKGTGDSKRRGRGASSKATGGRGAKAAAPGVAQDQGAPAGAKPGKRARA